MVQGYCDKPSDGATSSKGMKKASSHYTSIRKSVGPEVGNKTPLKMMGKTRKEFMLSFFMTVLKKIMA